MGDIVVGAKFGMLKVVKAEPDERGRYLCRCKCGREAFVYRGNLRSGHSKSCGCTRMAAMHDAARKHGHATQRTYVYEFWCEARKLCTNSNRKSTEYYKARGIKMHAAWDTDFSQFLADVGERPSPEFVLGRKNKRKGFVPGNVVWMTSRARQLGKKDQRLVTIDGVTKQLQEWADEYGIKKNTLHWRLEHWPAERWLEKPRDKRELSF